MEERDKDLNRLLTELLSNKYLPSYLLNNRAFRRGIDQVAYAGPYWDKEEIIAAISALLTAKWMTSGESVMKFERQFSKKFNFSSSVMVNSGSSANLVMIAALKKFYNWKDGDEIIVSAVGFPTTISAIIQNGLKPIFVDISWGDLNWNLDEIRKSITKNTRAVFSSPVLGNTYDLSQLQEICNSSDLKIIADNCDSLGSTWDEEFLTDAAVAASASFYPAHHMTTMEGGMISSKNDEIIELSRSFAWWGRDCYCVGIQNMLPAGTCKKRFSRWIEECDAVVDHKYVFSNIGYNLKPLDLQGAIGSVQLKKFEQMENLRHQNYQKLKEAISNRRDLRTLSELPRARTSWFGFPIICETSNLKREMVSFLEDKKIQTRNYFAGNILSQPAYRNYGDYRDFPVANQVLERVFFVGTSPTLTQEMISYVVDSISEFCDSKNL